MLAAIDIADGRRVKGCSLTVHAGEVVGLAGLIGAGRTELAHLIIGAAPRTSGRVELEGRAVDIRTPGEALDAGIAYLTEDRKALGLFLDMSCLRQHQSRGARPGCPDRRHPRPRQGP